MSQLPNPIPAIAPKTPAEASSGIPQQMPRTLAPAASGAIVDLGFSLMNPTLSLLLQEKVKGVDSKHVDRSTR